MASSGASAAPPRHPMSTTGVLPARHRLWWPARRSLMLASILAGVFLCPASPATAQGANREQRCASGDKQACCALGANDYLDKGAVEKLDRDGRPCALVCAQGYAEGCYSLGILHTIAMSPAAVGFFGRACELGHASGCAQAGAAYRFGSGVPADNARGLELYRRACTLGSVTACTDLGMLYTDGEVVPKDAAQAANWYRLAARWRRVACASGSAPDCAQLAEMLLNGEGAARDPQQAAVLFQKACDGNYPHACYGLAELYEAGQGVPRSVWNARWLRQQACRGAFPPACRSLYGPNGPPLFDWAVLIAALVFALVGAVAVRRLVAGRRPGWRLLGLALSDAAVMCLATLWTMDVGLRTLLFAAVFVVGPAWIAVALTGWIRARRGARPGA